MRTALVILVIVIALAVAGYCYWINSPYYAFQQAGLALKDHNREMFDKYVDAPDAIDHLLEDLLLQPALSTPHLSAFQTSVATGALAMAKAQVTRGMMEAIYKHLASDPAADNRGTSYWQNFGCEPAIASPGTALDRAMLTQKNNSSDATMLAQAAAAAPGCVILAQAPAQGGASLKDLFHAASHEMSGEVTKLKTVAFNRMLVYIQGHPDTVPGRLMNCPPAQRGAHARQMLEEYGLTPGNFKGIGDCITTTDLLGKQSAKVGFNFFSPKINKQIMVMVQVENERESGVWRIKRLANIKEVMDQVEENYDRDIHELVEYSLSGMNNANMANDLNGITDRLKQNPAAQNILNKWNLHFR